VLTLIWHVTRDERLGLRIALASFLTCFEHNKLVQMLIAMHNISLQHFADPSIGLLRRLRTYSRFHIVQANKLHVVADCIVRSSSTEDIVYSNLEIR